MNTMPNKMTITSTNCICIRKKHELKNKSRQLKPLFTDFQSTNTLQNTTLVYSFSKSPRFNNNETKFIPKNHLIVHFPSLFSKRATGFGYGERGRVEKKTSVSPDRYDVMKVFERERKQKMITLHSKLKQIESKSNNPGPGEYDIAKKSLLKDNPIVIKSRQLFYYDENIKNKSIVSPQAYTPNINNVLSNRFKSIGIGYGTKHINELIGIQSNPGPGSYDIPSQFNCKLRSKLAIN